ncbi:MAG: lysylphosphatidylglycerol synthase domain-containing protein, partial [Acidimicrobiales bacterium]
DLANGPAMLVRRMVRGRRLPALGADGVSDALLEDVWRQVLLLGEARIAHHDLRASNVLVDEDSRPWLADFAFARGGASPQWICEDRAEMLVSLASVVGMDRAVSSAAVVVPRAELRAALVYLQPLALPSRVRHQLGRSKPALAELAARLAAEVQEPPPSFRPQVSGRVILSLALLGGAVFILLPQLGTFPHLLTAVEHGNYWWMAVAFLFGAATFPMTAVSHMGSLRQRLPWWRTVWVQVASAFSSRLTPGGVGGMGTNMIFLERQGVERADAVGSVALNQAAGGVVHIILLVIAVGVVGSSGTKNIHLPTGWPVLLGVLVAILALGIFVGSPFGRRRVVAPAKRVLRNLVGTLSHPKRAIQLFGGSAGVTLCNGAALAAAVAAFDPHSRALSVIAVYVGGSAIAAAAPTPGGLGAIEAALAAGLTGIGIPSEPAVAAVLAYRLLTFWIPILPGLAAMRFLQRRRVL